MKARETIKQLEQVKIQLWRIRKGNKQAIWLCEMLKAIEVLLKAT